MSVERYPHGPGYKGSPSAGRKGAAYYAPQVRGRRAQVLAGLDAGPQTSEQIGECIGLHWYLVRPRLSELSALGLVTDTGEHGRSALGGKSTLWRQTTADERALFAARKAAEDEKGPSNG